jgi:membrane-bound lytic murein transglycosylase D
MPLMCCPRSLLAALGCLSLFCSVAQAESVESTEPAGQAESAESTAKAPDSSPTEPLLVTPSTDPEVLQLHLKVPVDEILPEESAPAPAIDLTVSPDNLWQRIRNGFGMPDLHGPLVADRQAWYLNRPETLNRIIERSGKYLHHIVEELERRGMPTELALLPMVESAFNPLAASRARALGMWQFIPSTGKNFKLDQNWWRDERRDILASTSAALDYLQKIYELHGDWHLALASYNWGEGAVGRAIAKNRAKGLPTHYENLSMPTETRYYVPKLQALKNIIAQPELFGFRLDPLPNRPYFGAVGMPGDIDVTLAAKLAEVPLDEFIALNPAFHRPTMHGDRDSQILLPTDKVGIFRSNLARHEAQDKPLTHWRTYRLGKDDRLDTVARRFGLSLAGLKQLNGITPRMKVGPGHNLLVPGPGAQASTQLAALLPKVPTEAGKGRMGRHKASGHAKHKATGASRKPVKGRKR